VAAGGGTVRLAAWLLLGLSVVAALAAFVGGVAGLAAEQLLGLIALALGLYLGGVVLSTIGAGWEGGQE
jgi:hypothetical protein